MKKSKHKRFYQGFTLLEVMVTLIIIGILSSFAIVSSSKSKERALQKKAYQDLKLIHRSLDLHRAKNNNVYLDFSGEDPDDLYEYLNDNIDINLIEHEDLDLDFTFDPTNSHPLYENQYMIGIFPTATPMPAPEWRIEVNWQSGEPFCQQGSCTQYAP